MDKGRRFWVATLAMAVAALVMGSVALVYVLPRSGPTAQYVPCTADWTEPRPVKYLPQFIFDVRIGSGSSPSVYGNTSVNHSFNFVLVYAWAQRIILTLDIVNVGSCPNEPVFTIYMPNYAQVEGLVTFVTLGSVDKMAPWTSASVQLEVDQTFIGTCPVSGGNPPSMQNIVQFGLNGGSMWTLMAVTPCYPGGWLPP